MNAPTVVLRATKVPEGSAIGVGQAFPLHAHDIVVGRSVDADIVLPDRTVSRRHLRIAIADAVTVTALTSANGTFLDRLPLEVGDAVRVPPAGAELQLGGVVFELEVLADTTPVFQPDAVASRDPVEPPLLQITWDAGQCEVRCGSRALGLNGVAARFLGVLAESAGQVVHHWDLQQELKTAHLSPLASIVRQALRGAIEEGTLPRERVVRRVEALTGRSGLATPDLMRGLVAVRRGHGYALNLDPADVTTTRT